MFLRVIKLLSARSWELILSDNNDDDEQKLSKPSQEDTTAEIMRNFDFLMSSIETNGFHVHGVQMFHFLGYSLSMASATPRW